MKQIDVIIGAAESMASAVKGLDAMVIIYPSRPKHPTIHIEREEDFVDAVFDHCRFVKAVRHGGTLQVRGTASADPFANQIELIFCGDIVHYADAESLSESRLTEIFDEEALRDLIRGEIKNLATQILKEAKYEEATE